MSLRTHNGSLYRFYSMGIVVEDKEPGSDYILVLPIEELSIVPSGLVNEQEEDFEGTKGSVEGVDFITKHTSKNYVRAKWKSIGNGNRTSPPDVVCNESVMIYKYGNVDEYYWDEIGREPSLRRLEDVLYTFSNVPEGIGTESYDKESSYWIHVSTRDKYIQLHTSDNDGEACTFDMRIDTGEGTIHIEDGMGNFVHWDAVAGTHETNFNTEIIRRAPTITDESELHQIHTTDYINKASSTITEETTDRLVSASSTIGEQTDTRTLEATQMNNIVAAEIVNDVPMMSNSGSIQMSAACLVGGGLVIGVPVVVPPPPPIGGSGGGGGASVFSGGGGGGVDPATIDYVEIDARYIRIKGPLTQNGTTEINGSLGVSSTIDAGGIISAPDVSTDMMSSANAHIHTSAKPGDPTSPPMG